MWMLLGKDPLCTSSNEESGPLANNAPRTGFEPNFFDDYHYSETLKFSSRSHPATQGPRTCMTGKCDSENEQIRILLERQKEQISADFQAETQKHEFQADYDRSSIQKLNGVIESHRSETTRSLAGDEQLRRDQQLLHEQLLEENRDLCEAHMNSLNEMEELKRFQGSTFDDFSRRRLIEGRDTIVELTAKIQELQNEVNCMSDSRDLQDAESVRSGQSQVTSQPVFFPHHPDPGGMLSRSLGMPSRNNRPQSIWDTHGISGNVFANPTASFSVPYPQESKSWVSTVTEHTSPHVMSESQTPNTFLDPRCKVRTVSHKFIRPK